MKKLILILFMVLLNTVLFSCTPEAITDNDTHVMKIENNCCGVGEGIPPPQLSP